MAARELTRRALYNLVWSKPMTRVAEEFGISDWPEEDLPKTPCADTTTGLLDEEGNGETRHPDPLLRGRRSAARTHIDPVAAH